MICLVSYIDHPLVKGCKEVISSDEDGFYMCPSYTEGCVQFIGVNQNHENQATLSEFMARQGYNLYDRRRIEGENQVKVYVSLIFRPRGSTIELPEWNNAQNHAQQSRSP